MRWLLCCRVLAAALVLDALRLLSASQLVCSVCACAASPSASACSRAAAAQRRCQSHGLGPPCRHGWVQSGGGGERPSTAWCIVYQACPVWPAAAVTAGVRLSCCCSLPLLPLLLLLLLTKAAPPCAHLLAWSMSAFLSRIHTAASGNTAPAYMPTDTKGQGTEGMEWRWYVRHCTVCGTHACTHCKPAACTLQECTWPQHLQPAPLSPTWLLVDCTEDLPGPPWSSTCHMACVGIHSMHCCQSLHVRACPWHAPVPGCSGPLVPASL
jgi:hypothetical protein